MTSAARAEASDARSAALAPLVVLTFWWLATGVLFVAGHAGGRRVAAAALAAGAAASGIWLLVIARDRREPRGAVTSFLGGALLWMAVSAALYGGWVVGPPDGAVAAAPRTLALALAAIRATAYNDALALAALGTAYVATRRATMRVGWHAIALFWAAHQSARLNLFLGVANTGADLLPAQLASLARYFGPARNGALLPIATLAFAALATWLALRARQSRDGARAGLTLLATLALLAALEHALLGIAWRPPLWAPFLATHGG